jgi:signal transduction histidine kinase
MDIQMPHFTPEIELTIFRALQEGLTNGIRHGASTRFHFSLFYQNHQIQFRLTDYGNGSSHIVRGFGLNSMKDRVEEAGGGLTIAKNESTAGVTLEIVIPYPSNPKERNENIG